MPASARPVDDEGDPGDRLDTVRQLRERIRAMQATSLGSRGMPTHPAVAPLLPGQALQAGTAVAVPGSTSLAMLLLAGPSGAGAWCGVVGVPEFGVEAAAGFGVDLGRLVLVPTPGQHWLTVAAQLADVLPMVLVRPPTGRYGADASPGEVARLASRLRQRGAVLVVLGAWPDASVVLEVEESRWSGIDAGAGYLAGREVVVAASPRGQPVRRHRLWISDGFLGPEAHALSDEGPAAQALPDERQAVRRIHPLAAG